MPYLPFAPASDNRSARGASALRVVNMQIERAAMGSGKPAGYYLAPTPGFTSRVTPRAGYDIRGLFARPGVRDGLLHVVAGQTLYSIDSSWVATSIGTIDGSGNVLFDALRDVLIIVGGGFLYTWNGTALTKATDVDLSTNLYTLATLGQRAITSARETDQLEWSAVLDAQTWPADGFATSEISPDPVIANVVVGDELYSLGKVSTQIWRAVGGADADAFDTFAGQLIDKGCIARDSACRVDASIMWLADDRCVYRAIGPDAQRVPNRALEIALAAMPADQVAQCAAYSYTDGSKIFYVLRPPVGPAYAYDVGEEQWQERSTFGAAAHRYAYYAYAYDTHIVSGPEADAIYTMEHGTYSDDGDALERMFMAHVPVPTLSRVDNLGFDVKAYGQPLTGQGSDPEMMITFYRDGGNVESIASGIERRVTLGANGNWLKRPTVWRLGQARSDGFVVKGRITDPIGCAVHGFWINEGKA